MENQANIIEDLFEKAEEYGKTSIDLFKLKAIDKSSDVLSSLASYLAILFIIFITMLILNIGIALLIGEWLGKSYYGFFILAAFYGILGVVLFLFRNVWIKVPISQLIITQALK
ncbi:MAG: hypothetical protein ACYCVH_11180 [Ignavibacteriaceae bacterium]